MAVLWENCARGENCARSARVLRVLGDTPCPVVPDTVDGLPVVEIGPYCFADRAVTGGALWPADSADTHEVTGNFVQEVTLPDTVRVIDSAAFYNCRKLRRVRLGKAADSFGSDLFTNCRSLEVLELHAGPGEATGLRRLLVAISADVTVEFTGGVRLFYPEYFELLDENTPAHIFNHSIEGEGYRMRQCFAADGSLDFAAYDASFAQACVGESEEKLCRLALGRLCLPYGLGDDARADYEFYLAAHPDAAFTLAITARDEAAVKLLVGLGLPTANAAAFCARQGWSAGAALLLGRPKRAAKKTYGFDDL